MSEDTGISTNDSSAKSSLAGYVERIESLNENKKDIQDDIKSVYQEAKSEGFDTKALRKVISNRQKDRAELEHLDGIVETYENALSDSE